MREMIFELVPISHQVLQCNAVEHLVNHKLDGVPEGAN